MKGFPLNKNIYRGLKAIYNSKGGEDSFITDYITYDIKSGYIYYTDSYYIVKIQTWFQYDEAFFEDKPERIYFKFSDIDPRGFIVDSYQTEAPNGLNLDICLDRYLNFNDKFKATSASFDPALMMKLLQCANALAKPLPVKIDLSEKDNPSVVEVKDFMVAILMPIVGKKEEEQND